MLLRLFGSMRSNFGCIILRDFVNEFQNACRDEGQLVRIHLSEDAFQMRGRVETRDPIQANHDATKLM